MFKAINDYGKQLFLFNLKVCLKKTRSCPHSLLWMLLLISSIGAVKSTPTCNSFPKIFGGSLSNTTLIHIDAFNDYLALAGSTKDNDLTGIITTDTIPYLALASISGGGKYYWAKALSLKRTTTFVAV
jgi:hypothetical protein